MTKGQINLMGLFAVGVSIAIASIGSFFYQSNRIGSVETRAAVLETQYENINSKLDKVIEKLEKQESKEWSPIFIKK